MHRADIDNPQPADNADSAESSRGPRGTEDSPGGGLAERWAWLAPLLAALPVLVATVSVLVQGWTPSGDQAFELLRVADVGTAHTPLVGTYSRWGWDHPGPLLFWVTAPAYRLVGPVGVAAMVGLVNAAAVALAVVAARRIGGALLGWLAAAAALLVVGSMGDTVVDPWNPYVGLLPLLAYLLCAWRAADGDVAVLVAAVVMGTYAAQAHLGYVPIVVAAAVLASAAALVRWRRGGVAVSRPAGLAVLALAAGLWSGPIIEQTLDKGGNLRDLWTYASGSDQPVVGWSTAVHVSSRLFGVPAPWMGARASTGLGFPVEASPLAMIAVVVGASAIALAAWRRGDHGAASLVAFAVALTGVSLVAVSRVTGLVAPYLLEWTWPVAALVWVAAIWAVARLPDSSSRRSRLSGLSRITATAALAATVGLVGVGAMSAATVTPPADDNGQAVAALSAQIRQRLDRSETYGAIAIDPLRWGAVGFGVTADLQRRGWDVRAPASAADLFTRWRVTRRVDKLPTIAVAQRNELRPWTPPSGARHIASYDPLDQRERRELTELAARVYGATDDARGRHPAPEDDLATLANADPDDLSRLQTLRTAIAYDAWLIPAHGRDRGR